MRDVMLVGRGLERLDRSRSHHILSQEEVKSKRSLNFCLNHPFAYQVAGGKTTSWPELEITGTIKNLSPALWRLQHLTALYLNDNSLFRIPPSISLLQVRHRLLTSAVDHLFVRISSDWTCQTTNCALFLQKLAISTGYYLQYTS